MATCINRGLKEFQDLVEATGLNEYVLAAKVKTWQEENNSDQFPTAKQVTTPVLDPEQESTLFPTPDEAFSVTEQQKRKADEFMQEFVIRIQNNLGLTAEQVEHVTEEEAAVITADAINPIGYQPSFYYNGKVYLVKGRFNYKTQIHEFSHVLVKAIRQYNPVLFNKIYDEVISDGQGIQFLNEAINENPELDSNHDQIKEETIVKVMTYLAENRANQDLAKQPSNILMKAIQKIIYAIKQALRKLSTKVDPKNLDVDTDLKTLTDMLVDSSWNINMDLINKDDIVAYMGEREISEKELNRVLNAGEGVAAGYKIYDQNVNIARNQYNDMMREGKYSDILDVLQYDDSQSFVERAQSNLVGFSLKSRIEKAKRRKARLDKAKTDKERAEIVLENEREELEEFQERNRQLYENLVLEEHKIQRITRHLKFLADEPDQQAAFKNIPVYIRHLKSSASYLNSFDEELRKTGLDSQAQIRKDIGAILTDINDAEESINNIVQKAISESLSERFNAGMSKGVEKKNQQIEVYRAQIEKRPKDKAHLEREIARLERERNSMLKSPEVMLDYLMGRNGDISYMSSQLENFISSQDPSISTFAKYIKDNHSIVRVKANKGKNDLQNAINPLIKEMGVKPSDLNEFSKRFLFTDISTRRNKETGQLEKYEVKTLKNEFQNYKYDLGILRDTLNKANEAWQNKPTDENFEELSRVSGIYQNHLKYFFKREYVDEYYHADDELLAATYTRSDRTVIEIGRIAKEEAQEAFQKVIQFQNAQPDADIDYLTNFETVERALLDYRKLFSLYDDYGKKKTGEDLRKAQLLIENRDKKRKYHDYKPIKNAFENALKGAEAKFKVELEELDLPKEEFDRQLEAKIQAWINQNTRAKYKDSFYKMREIIFKEIEAILGDTQGDPFQVERQQLMETLQGRKDDDGQPVATEMSKELLSKIKSLQETILEGKELAPKIKDLDLSDAAHTQLILLFGQLQNLQKTEATSYYIDILDSFYRRIKKAEGETNPMEITLDNVDDFLSPTKIEELKGKDPEFDQWFEDNHILKTKWFPEGTMQSYERIKPWSIVKPREAKYIEKTEIYDDNGLVVRTIEGIPKMKYYKRYVKDKYTTGYNAGTKEVNPNAHFDIQGFQLPKSLEDMEKFISKEENRELLDKHNQEVKELIGEDVRWDRYINREYLELKKKNNAEYKLLETLRDFHFKSQQDLDKNKTLGNELPRERRDNYQYLKSGDAAKHAKEKAQMIKKGVMQIWGKKADDYEHGVNYEEQERLVGAEAYAAEEGTRIPIRGKYNLDIDQVSDDVLKSLFTYYLSAEQNKMLNRLSPTAEGILKMAENQPTLFKTIKQGKVNGVEQSEVRVPIGVSKDNRRQHLLQGMVEIMFEGKTLKESNNNPTGVKVVNSALGIAAHSFFALDLTSALKNFYGAQFQIALEAAGNKYFSYKNWHRGRPWAFQTMTKISKEIYAEGPKSLEVQMVDIFDAIQARHDEKFGESPSRSIARDIASLSWLTSHRKWLETEATLQIFSAIMHDTKVVQEINGEKKELRYIDAFELDDTGTITLKPGIDKAWAPGGEKFLDTVNHNHETSNFLQGMYAQADKPLVNRAIAWRMFGSLKNYFTKMFLHRYAAGGLSLKDPSSWINPQERLNLATGQMHMGFYWQNILTLKKLVQSGFKHVMYLNPEEKRAMILGALGFLKIQLFGLASYLIMASFGTDPDDKNRWSKMQKQTGALPSVITNDKWAKQFELSGWLRAHLMLLIMSVETEANAFIPSPGYGMNHMYNTVAGQSSIAMGASFEAIKDMVSDLFFTVTGDDRVYYKRDTGGLKTKEEGTNKFLHKLMRMSGVSGKFVDPLTTAKNIEAARHSGRS